MKVRELHCMKNEASAFRTFIYIFYLIDLRKTDLPLIAITTLLEDYYWRILL